MPHYRYLIVGASMTGDAAVHGIREVDPAEPIGLIGAEPHPPYNRPPLSKGLWKGESEDSIWRSGAKTLAQLHLGRRVVSVDPTGRRVTDQRGAVYGYRKLLLATGGSPRRLPLETDQIVHYRTLDDYRRLRPLAGEPLRFAVIGGGFIGSEGAAALRLQGRGVGMLVPEGGAGAR